MYLSIYLLKNNIEKLENFFKVRDLQPRAPLLGRRPKPRYSNNDKTASTFEPPIRSRFNSLANSKGGAAPFVAVSVALRGSLRYKKISAWSKKNGLRLKNFFAKKF